MWREDGWDAPGNYGFDPLGLGKLLCGENDSKKVVVQVRVLGVWGEGVGAVCGTCVVHISPFPLPGRGASPSPCLLKVMTV